MLCVRMVWKTYRKYWQGTCTESGERYSPSLHPYFVCPITKVISVIPAAWADVVNIYIITNDVALWAENSWLCEARSSFQVSGSFLFAAWQLLKGSPSQPVISRGILGISTRSKKREAHGSSGTRLAHSVSAKLLVTYQSSMVAALQPTHAPSSCHCSLVCCNLKARQ